MAEKSYFMKLLPEQIANFWDVIKVAVEQALPPSAGRHPDGINKILTSALMGDTDVWTSYTKDEEGNNKFDGIVMTQVIYDGPTGDKQLLIYILYGNLISKTAWTNGIKALAKYAKSLNCSRIVAYSKEKVVLKVSERLGGNADYRFIQFDPDEIIQKLNGLEV